MIGYSKLAQMGPSKVKQVQKNHNANTKLDNIYKKKGKYDKCELRIAKNCLPREIESFGVRLKMTYAHRHKRDWYKQGNNDHLLYSYNQTIRCCIPCHMVIEADSNLTEKLFKLHRSGK